MEENIIDQMAAEAKSVEELLSHYPQGAKKSRSVARDVARRALSASRSSRMIRYRRATACRVEAGDKVGFDYAVLDQLGELEDLTRKNAWYRDQHGYETQRDCNQQNRIMELSGELAEARAEVQRLLGELCAYAWQAALADNNALNPPE